MGVADGGSEGEREFLGLCVGREGGREAGEILEAQTSSLDRGAQLGDLAGGQHTEPGGARLGAIALRFERSCFAGRFGGRGGMAKGHGEQARGAVGGGQNERGLEEALGAREVGLKARAERVAALAEAWETFLQELVEVGEEAGSAA